jgi:hypothetical protein
MKSLLKRKKIFYHEYTLNTTNDKTIFKTVTNKTTVPQLGWTPSKQNLWDQSLHYSSTKQALKNIHWLGGYTEIDSMFQHVQKSKKEPWFQKWSYLISKNPHLV